MAIYRRPVSARRSIRKARKAYTRKRTYTPPRMRSSGSTLVPGRISGLSRQDFGFPDRLKTKLHYCDVVQLAASAGNPGLWEFRMNSLFDPDFTGTGHQPQWFDQLASVYLYYKVTSSKITVTFIPNNVSDIEANDRGPYIVGITCHPGQQSFTAASYAALLEDGNSVNGVIVDKQGANNAKTLSNTFSVARDLGVSTMDDTVRCLTTANPPTASAFYATLWALDMTELASQDVACKVEIEFNCEFDQRRENVLS